MVVVVDVARGVLFFLVGSNLSQVNCTYYFMWWQVKGQGGSFMGVRGDQPEVHHIPGSGFYRGSETWVVVYESY